MGLKKNHFCGYFLELHNVIKTSGNILWLVFPQRIGNCGTVTPPFLIVIKVVTT